MQLWLGAGLVCSTPELNKALLQHGLAWWVIWKLVSFPLVNCQSQPHLGWREVVFEKVTSPYRLSPPTLTWKASENKSHFHFCWGMKWFLGKKHINLILLWLVRKFIANHILKCGHFKICLNKGWIETSNVAQSFLLQRKKKKTQQNYSLIPYTL